MKKTILATAMTTLFAASTQAATIYEKNNFTLDLFGDVEIVYLNSLDENESAIIDIDEADMGFDLGYALNDDVTLSGLVEFGIADGTATLSNAWVGVASNQYGKLTVGKQATIYDDSGIGADYHFGFTSFYDQENSGEQVIKYQVDKGNFYGGVAYLMNSEAGQTDGAEGFDANVGVRVQNADLTVYFADIDDAANVNSSNVNIELRYQVDSALGLAAAYAMDDTGGSETDSFGLTAVYQVSSKTSIAAGWASIDSESNPDLSNQYYVNTSYSLNDYMSVYAELGGNDDDDTELGYAAGMIVEF